MHKSAAHYTVVGLVAFAFGCTDAPQRLTSPPDLARVSAPTASSGPDQQVALAFARALAKPAVRAGLLKAMRASPLTEHKLVLQEYVKTASGQLLISSAAEASGFTSEELASLVETLSPLDLYVPSSAQRRTWHAGDANVVLSVALGGDRSSVIGFTPSGQAMRQTGTIGANDPVLILLQPAEAKGRRLNAQARADGDVIQDADDGEISVQLITYSPDGDSVVSDFGGPTITLGEHRIASLPKLPSICLCDICPEEDYCQTPPPPPPPTDTTFLSSMITRGVCDNGRCGEGNEFEFRAYYKDASGNPLYNQTLRITGVPSSGVISRPGGYLMLLREATGDGHYIDVDVVETDGFLNGDDDFDPNPVFAQLSDRDRSYTAGDLRYGSCPPEYPVLCTQLEMRFYWQ